MFPSSASASVNDVFQSFFDHVNSIVDKHAPLRKVTKKEIKSLSKPWITAGLKKFIKVKDKLYKKYLVSRDAYYHTKYKYYRNRVSHLRIAKKNYFQNYFNTNSRNIKNIWIGIKQLISCKPKASSPPSKIILNNQTLRDPIAIFATAFNKYFATIGCKLAGKI